MPPTIQVGTVLIDDSPIMTRFFGLQSAGYLGSWSVASELDVFTLDRKIHAAGWNFFFMAPEVNAMFFGTVGAKKVQNALRRILGKVTRQPFNALEVTGIVMKRFLGVPYTIVSAQSPHIQQSCNLDGRRGQWTSQIAAWNRKLSAGGRFRSAVS
jgi:hypothetical protein